MKYQKTISKQEFAQGIVAEEVVENVQPSRVNNRIETVRVDLIVEPSRKTVNLVISRD